MKLKTWWAAHQLLGICLLIFALAFSLRLAQGLRHLNFTQDQARDAYLMHEFRDQGLIFIPYGPKASVGNFYTPPLYYQIHYFFSWITGDQPLVMQWVTVLVESLTPVVLFLLLRLIFTQRAALFGSLVYALSVMVIIAGASAWNPNMIPFLTTLALYCWFHHLVKGSRWSVVVGCVAVTAAFHFHYQSVLVMPFAVIVLALSLRKKLSHLKYWLLGALLSVGTFLPYINAELHSNWQNTRTLISFFTIQRTQYFDRISKPAFVLSFLPSFLERVVLKNNLSAFIVGRIMFIGGLLALAIQARHNRRKLLLLAYFVVIFIMLRVYKGDKIDYYMSTLYILPAVLYATFSEYLKRWAVLPVIALAGLTIWSMAQMPYFNGLKNLDEATAYISEHTPGKTGRILFHNYEDINYFAYGLKYLHPFIIDPTSKTILDVCKSGQTCAWSADASQNSINGDNDTRAAALKAAFGYQEISRSSADSLYQIQIGTLGDKPTQTQPKYYEFNTTYGSDILLPQLNQY